MAISRKKQEAITKLINAENAVAKYRGITSYRFSWKPKVKMTIAQLNHCADSCMKLLEEDLPFATENQLNFLNILLKKDYNHSVRDHYNAAVSEGKNINKWQAIELINALKTNEDLIYTSFHVTQDEFAELEDRMYSIISMMK